MVLRIVVRSYADRATVVHATGSIAALRNRGAREGVGRYLCFLDSDVVVRDDYFMQARVLIRERDRGGHRVRVSPPDESVLERTRVARTHRA